MSYVSHTAPPVSSHLSQSDAAPDRPRRRVRPRARAAAAAALLLAAGPAGAAPVQWPVAEGGNGHYYEYVPVPLTTSISWPAARDAAANATYLGLPGHLATITSDAERLFVLNRSGATPQNRVPLIWLGAEQAAGATGADANWQWITGEPWAYTAWADGEPNDNIGGGNIERGNEQHLNMYFSPNVFAERFGQWNDQNGQAVRQANGYVVEFTVPEPSAAAALLGGPALLLRRRRQATGTDDSPHT